MAEVACEVFPKERRWTLLHRMVKATLALCRLKRRVTAKDSNVKVMLPSRIP